jgi:RNA polymerase sigma-70 factor (ECF subfamily)
MDCGSLSTEELVLRCGQSGDAAAWEEFIRRFHRPIATVVLRVARRWGVSSPQLIDDLVQDTYLKLCANDFRLLRSFKAHHPDAFYGYLKVVAANLVHDHFKAAHSAKRGSGAAEVAEHPEITPAANFAATPTAAQITERQILLQQLDALLRKLAQGPHLERDCRVFWLYYRTGLTASAIAALPSIGLSTKGVESTLLRLTRLLRQEMIGEKVADEAKGL